MVVVDHWVSDAEKARREADARTDAELESWWAEFKTADSTRRNGQNHALAHSCRATSRSCLRNTSADFAGSSQWP